MDIREYVTTTLKNTGTIEYRSRPFHSGNGLGNAHETLFGVSENNHKGPDVPLYNLELKSSQEGCPTLVTLITNSPKLKFYESRKSGTRMLVENFALPSEREDRKNLYTTLRVGRKTQFGPTTFEITTSNNSLVISADGVEITGWNIEDLTKAVRTKIGGSLLLTKGKAEGDVVTSCSFSTATLYEEFRPESFMNLLHGGEIVIDLRAHSVAVSGRPSLKIRDHGTAFRISEKNLPKLYETITKI